MVPAAIRVATSSRVPASRGASPARRSNSRPAMKRLQATGLPWTSVFEQVSRAGSRASSGWAALKLIAQVPVDIRVKSVMPAAR